MLEKRANKSGQSPRLNVELFSQGTANGFDVNQLETGSIKLQGASDRLQLELLEPMTLGLDEPTYKLRVEGNGPLNSWAGRLRPWLDSFPRELAGEAYLKAIVDVNGEAIHVY